jgi:toxin ParE1/3/4
MSKTIVRDRARQDIEEITDHIAANNLNAALRVQDRIEEAFELLTRLPGAGARIELSGSGVSGLRYWPIKKYRSYLIIYRPAQDGVEIIRVIHAAQDLRRVLRQ